MILVINVYMKVYFLHFQQITMWDLHKGKLIRTISDAHPMQNAVLHIKVSIILM